MRDGLVGLFGPERFDAGLAWLRLGLPAAILLAMIVTWGRSLCLPFGSWSDQRQDARTKSVETSDDPADDDAGSDGD